MAVISTEPCDEKSYQVSCGNMAAHVRVPCRNRFEMTWVIFDMSGRPNT